MHAATPTGSFTTRLIAPGPTGGTFPSTFVAQPPKYSNMYATSAMSSLASAIGLPESVDSSWESRSSSRRTMSAARSRIRPRSRGLVLGHHEPSSNARRAAVTARSTSFESASGTVATTSPVAGFTTSKRPPATASTHLPSTNIRNASAIAIDPSRSSRPPSLPPAGWRNAWILGTAIGPVDTGHARGPVNETGPRSQSGGRLLWNLEGRPTCCRERKEGSSGNCQPLHEAQMIHLPCLLYGGLGGRPLATRCNRTMEWGETAHKTLHWATAIAVGAH